MDTTTTHILNNLDDVLSFMFAGKATFTLRNSKSGNRFTYKVSAPRKQSNPSRPIYFVSVMTGTDNEKSYSFVGTLFGKFTYQHSRKSSLLQTAPSVNVFERFLAIVENHHLPNNVEIWHEGTCCHCGRKLTVPESLISGWGPECNKKRWKEAQAQLKLTLNK